MSDPVPEYRSFASTPNEPQTQFTPAQEIAASLLGQGYSKTKTAAMVGCSRQSIDAWTKLPGFLERVDLHKRELIANTRRSTLDLTKTFKSKIQRILDKVDPDRVDADDPRSIAALADATKTVDALDREHLGLRSVDATSINVSAIANASASATVITVAPTMDEFVQQDLGVPLHEIWPRVVWTLRQIDRSDVRVAVLMLGAGSGKTTLAELTLVRQLQRLAAMPSPSAAFGSRSDQLIGVANLSGSGKLQAQMAIFTDLKRDVMKSPWFKSHSPPDDTKEMVLFPKNVVAVSGNSSSISEEGINLVAGAADELSRMDENAGNEIRADDLVEPIRKTMITRFPKHYKLVLMSWPSHLEDYMHKEIARAEADGVVEDLTQAFLDSPITRGTPEAEQARRAELAEEPWRAEPVRAFISRSGVFVLRAPLWQMRPDADLVELAKFRARDEFNFQRMVAANPKRAGANPYLADLDAVKRGANPARQHPFDDEALHAVMWQQYGESDAETAQMLAGIKSSFLGEPPKGSGAWMYWGRFDLGVKKDSCGISIAHYENGRIVYDLKLQLKPEPGKPVWIRFVCGIFRVYRDLGFDFGRVEFDSYEGQSRVQEFQSHGFDAQTKSVDTNRKAYDVWRSWLTDDKLDYYAYASFFECCQDLVDMGRKIDHIPGGKKDVTDACCGLVRTILKEELGIEED